MILYNENASSFLKWAGGDQYNEIYKYPPNDTGFNRKNTTYVELIELNNRALEATSVKP